MMFAAIDWGLLLQIIYVAPLVAVGFTALFSVILYGSIRASDARRDDAGGTAALFGVLVVVGSLAFVAALVTGLGVILNK